VLHTALHSIKKCFHRFNWLCNETTFKNVSKVQML
jgi:hypothetical protein